MLFEQGNEKFNWRAIKTLVNSVTIHHIGTWPLTFLKTYYLNTLFFRNIYEYFPLQVGNELLLTIQFGYNVMTWGIPQEIETQLHRREWNSLNKLRRFMCRFSRLIDNFVVKLSLLRYFPRKWRHNYNLATQTNGWNYKMQLWANFWNSNFDDHTKIYKGFIKTTSTTFPKFNKLVWADSLRQRAHNVAIISL